MRRDGPPPAFALPTGAMLRLVVLILLAVTTTTRFAAQFTWSERQRIFGEGGPECVEVWRRNLELMQAMAAQPSIRGVEMMHQLREDHLHCFEAPNPLPLEPGLFMLVVVAGLTVVQYGLGPGARITRRRLVQLPLEAMPDLRHTLEGCCAVAGVRVRFLLDVLNPRVGGIAFGHPGRRRVALNRGLLVHARADPEAFRAIVLHELAHVRNRDLDITALTLAVWRAFLVGALAPIVLLLLTGNTGFLASYPPSPTLWHLGLMTALMLLLRNAVLRHREHCADARAAHWLGDPSALLRVLGSSAGQDRLRRLLRLHPSPVQRLQAFVDWRALWIVPVPELAAFGMIVGLAWPSVLQQLSRLTLLPAPVRYVGWQLAALTVPVGLAVALAVWRAVRFARITQTRSRAAGLGLAFAAGAAVGGLLIPVESSFGLLRLRPEPQWQASWSSALFAGCWLWTGWVALTARIWSSSASPRVAAAVAKVGAGTAAVVLTAWLAPLLRARALAFPLADDVPVWDAAVRLLASGAPAGWFDPSTILGRFLLTVAIVVLSLPLLGVLLRR